MLSFMDKGHERSVLGTVSLSGLSHKLVGKNSEPFASMPQWGSVAQLPLKLSLLK